MQLYPCKIQDGQGDHHRNWNGDTGNRSHPHRKQYQGYHYHCNDGDQEFLQKVIHRIAYVLRQFRDFGCFNAGRKVLFKFLQGFVHILAIRHDVVARLHLKRKQNGSFSVLANEIVGFVVLSFDGGNVLKPNYIAVGVGVNNLLGQVLFGFKIGRKMYRHNAAAVIKFTGVAHHTVCLVGTQQRQGFYVVFVQHFRPYIYKNLFFLEAEVLDFRGSRNLTAFQFEFFQLFLKFFIASRVGR